MRGFSAFEEGGEDSPELARIVEKTVMTAAWKTYQAGIGNQTRHFFRVGEGSGRIVFAPYQQGRS